MVASMSIPWGETKNDSDPGGYHLVWTGDLVQRDLAGLGQPAAAAPTRAPEPGQQAAEAGGRPGWHSPSRKSSSFWIWVVRWTSAKVLG